MNSFKLILSLVFILNALLLSAQPYADEKAEYRIVAVSQSNEADSLVSVSNSISLGNPLAIEIPSAFTPNGDGLNDTFGAVARGLSDYKLVVYNRHGNVVFQSNNVDIKWDGTFNGQDVPSGGYMYELYADSYESGSVTKSGKIMVVR